jgi:hypothetical protein
VVDHIGVGEDILDNGEADLNMLDNEEVEQDIEEVE